MVDINNLYYSDFGDCLPSYHHHLQEQQSPCQIINDYLENIDENDLINFQNACNDFDTSPSQFFIETPPETPINHTSCTSNNHNSKDTNTLNEKLLDFNSNFNEILEKQSIINETENLTVPSHQPSISLTNGLTTLPINYTIQPTTIAVTCPHPSPTVLANTNDSCRFLKGYNLDNNSALNCKMFDSPHISKNHIQPKAILPNKASNNKLKVDDREILKKQKLEARKLRNREAALNSRLKKKEYIENLESQVKKLNKENTDLLLENALLKQKIIDQEQELCKFRNLDINGNYDANSRKKAKISFFAVIFMLFFQISPYLMSISPSNDNSTIIANKNLLVKSPVNTHFSRTLLWNSQEITDEEYFKFRDKENYNSSIGFYVNGTNRCNDYFNKTELIRLENELRGWLTRFKLEENESKRRFHSYISKQNTKKLLYDLKHVPIPRLKLWMQKQRYIGYINDELDQRNLDQFFPFDFENLMSMVHRRDDTFYYLSYPSKGHLILPPISNRTDIRPRFSFLIPTFYNFSLKNSSSEKSQSQNETALTIPQLFMLQIDCQVINTKVTLVNVDNHRFSNKIASSVLEPKKPRLFKSS